MTMPHNRTNSCCNFMASLAFSDFCMMYVAIHLWVLSPNITRAITFYECKVLAYGFNLFSDIGIYTIVFMTIDRFIAVRFPFKMSHVCTPRRARRIIVGICISAVIYTLPYLYATGIVNGRLCSSVAKKTTIAQTYSWINTFVASVFPFCSLLTMNVMIIKTILERGKHLKRENFTKNKKSEAVNGKSSDIEISISDEQKSNESLPNNKKNEEKQQNKKNSDGKPKQQQNSEENTRNAEQISSEVLVIDSHISDAKVKVKENVETVQKDTPISDERIRNIHNSEARSSEKLEKSKEISQEDRPTYSFDDKSNKDVKNAEKCQRNTNSSIKTPKKDKNSEQIRTKTKSSDTQLAVMLTLISIAFLFLTLPVCIRYILAIMLDHTNNPYHNAIYTFVYHLSQKLYFTNNAVNFYLYCIGGAKFRADLAKVCGWKTMRRQRGRSDSSVVVNVSTISETTL